MMDNDQVINTIDDVTGHVSLIRNECSNLDGHWHQAELEITTKDSFVSGVRHHGQKYPLLKGVDQFFGSQKGGDIIILLKRGATLKGGTFRKRGMTFFSSKF